MTVSPTARFGHRMLERMGWSVGKGCGAAEDGARCCPCSKYGLSSNMMALTTSGCVRPAGIKDPVPHLPTHGPPIAIPDPRNPRGGSWLTAAVPVDNPYCSCKLTRVPPRQAGAGMGSACSRTT